MLVGEGHAPLGEYFARLRKKATQAHVGPKGVGPWDRSPFLLQSGNFLGCRRGGHGAEQGPQQQMAAVTVYVRSWLGRSCPRCGSTSLACGKADESIAAPKGADPGPSQVFPCKIGSFWGPRKGAMIAFMDPLTRRRS